MQLAAQTQMSTSVSNPAISKKVRSKEVIIYKYYAYVGSKISECTGKIFEGVKEMKS